jgi:hypothetical protein
MTSNINREQDSGVPGDNTSGTFVSANDPASPDDATAAALARITEDGLAPAERRNALGQLAAALRRRGLGDLFRPRAVLNWISDTVVDVAPRIPLRSLATLRAQHPGLSDEVIADRIVNQAARASASIGAVGGGLTSIEWVVPPTLLTAPVILGAETLAVVAVEIKMVGELQELYGQPVPGGSAQRAASLVQAWAHRRGVNLLVPGGTVTAVLGTAARTSLRVRLLRRFGRNLTTLGPLLTGAAIAAYLNRRATRKLAEEIRADLTRTRPQLDGEVDSTSG